MKKKWITILITSVVFYGCYYDVEQQLYGISGPCDISNVTFSSSITSVLQNYGCLGCHSGVSASGGIRLDSYSYVKTMAINGKLYGSINYNSGYSPMPKGSNKMLSCDINKVKAWINSGSPNN